MRTCVRLREVTSARVVVGSTVPGAQSVCVCACVCDACQQSVYVLSGAENAGRTTAACGRGYGVLQTAGEKGCVCVQVSFSKFERSSKIGVCVMVSSVAFEHGATGRARRRLAPVPVRVLRGGEMLAISCAARKDFHSVEQ